MGKLISVNVGMPKDVLWRDHELHTGIFKAPVDGQVMVRRLNLDGDGQGDLNGHGGEDRAVLVYQTEALQYWREYLQRDDFVHGCFGENFTVSGLSDSEVCIGDRYRIGEAEFEVSQPRVTCFRLGMRLNAPDLPRLLVAHGRPGFYLRVLTEGRVQAGDEIVQTQSGRHRLSVAAVDRLLYLPDRDPTLLRRAVELPALSPGWLQSFQELLCPPRSQMLAWKGFRPLRVTARRQETRTVLSVELSADGALPPAHPGQFLLIRADGVADPAPVRSYSLSGPTSSGVYRISVKREGDGLVSRWIHEHLGVGDTLQSTAPRGDFRLADHNRPIVLVSAGIGVTPVLAMLHSLAAHSSRRRVIWIHTTPDPEAHAFAREVQELLAELPAGEQHIFYTRATPPARLDTAALAALDLSGDADAYLCGPTSFMAAMRDALIDVGILGTAIHTEAFGVRSAINPGSVRTGPEVRPHPPAGPPGSGPQVTFSRAGVTVRWPTTGRSLLDLADACDVPTRYSCRSGVCHVCSTGLIAGTVAYNPSPLDDVPDGCALICCATPTTDVVLDL